MGEKIKALRNAKGLSQEELGKMVGVQKAAIYKYETGLVTNLKRDMIGRLAWALDCTPAYLMGWEEKQAPVTRPSVPLDERIVAALQNNQKLYQFVDWFCDVPPEQQDLILAFLQSAIERIDKSHDE